MAGCGGTPTPRPRTNVAPPRPSSGALSIEANQNGPRPLVEEDGDELVLLWCSQPEGPACVSAQEELGLVPTPTEAVPDAVRERARDTDDDCNDPEIAPLIQRITGAIRARGRLVDYAGAIPDPRLLADRFSGPGCMNTPGPADPTAKVHVAESADGPRVLVRVWEAGE